ncbi:uncharacterized protein LOC122023219 [Zingiber officinale]|uniref:Uncharacterized protein n=1 Tax=Zingiber officinale TaxID=94328 RepID=A0A8J5K957_ZINOF|nr:uncharacterized protein LOC122023219 [Zingiber officinale]KAG6476940.1 hypothetical protein ZIOFF_066190 [Zingiber officinale]
MIPWCLHLVGASVRTSPTPDGAGVRVVAYDGRVKVYDRPVTAAEVMKDHPCHLVCRSDAFFIGQKVPPVAAGVQLQPGQSYFLFPSHFFHSVLSFVTLAASLVGPGGKGAAAVRPFDIRKTAAGTLQITLSDEFLKGRERDGEQSRSKGVVTTDALEKEYRMLVRCKSRQWAPKLETIRESERRSKMGIESFKRRRKKESH